MNIKNTVGIIILNYNNYNDTINCINSIEKFNTFPIKYIIVDNGSTNPESVIKLDEFLKNAFKDKYKKIEENQPSNTLPYVSLLVSHTNDGYARGNNKGLELASRDEEIKEILILNNDVIFVEDTIPTLLAEKSKLKDCAIISPALYTKDLSDYDYTCARMAPSTWSLIKECFMLGLNINSYRNVIKQKYWLFIKNPELKHKDILEIEMPSGSCMLLNKKLFKEIGWFDPNTFLYFEENILYSKIYSRGLKNYLLPKLSCIHLGASSTKKVASYFIQRCGLESRTYYLKTYCHLNLIQKIVYNISYMLLSAKLYILKLVRTKQK